MLENINWSGEIAENNFCQVGFYLGHIIDWEFGKSLKKGTDYLELKLETDDGKKAKKTFYLTDKTMPYVARNLSELGRPIKAVEDLLTLNFKNIRVKFKVVDDEEYTKVDWIVAQSEDLAKPAPDVVTTEDKIPF